MASQRTALQAASFLGISAITFGPQVQVYYLIAVWCFGCMIAMYALTHTPLGRIANAVRDNPERAEFIGYNTQRVRWLMLILSSFFAGVAGALTAINFEIVSAENVSAVRSGGVLLAAFIGGTAFFFGPILGAVVFVFFAVALSEYTKAWQLYLGVFFVLLVMYAPGGLSSLILMNLRVLKFKQVRASPRSVCRAAAGGAGARVRHRADDRIDVSRHAECRTGARSAAVRLRVRHDARARVGVCGFSIRGGRGRLRVLSQALSSSNGTKLRSKSKTGSARTHEPS